MGFKFSAELLALLGVPLLFDFASGATADPCAAIAGLEWVTPAALRECFRFQPLNETIKNNVLDVVNKTFAFQTSINYQIQAPAPFENDVHVNIMTELRRIKGQSYPTQYDFHLDISSTIKKLQDGHTLYQDFCYDATYLNFNPFPVTLITTNGQQNLHIAPEAFEVISAALPGALNVWTQAVGGNLSQFSGAKILAINGNDPWDAVNANAAVTGGYQALSTRQNRFFSTYFFNGPGDVGYEFGDFAQQSLPITDKVTLTVVLTGQTRNQTITVPYMSQFGAFSFPFTDSESFLLNNCIPIPGSTNGQDLNSPFMEAAQVQVSPSQQRRRRGRGSTLSPQDMKRPRNVMADTFLTDADLPSRLVPQNALNGTGGIPFYQLPDGKTGVLALGSFESEGFDQMEQDLLNGLQQLKSNGISQLLIDLTDNTGGFICIAAWLHRILVGPRATSVPQALLDTKARDQLLAPLIVNAIIENGVDPDDQLLYNPLMWTNASNVRFSASTNWLEPPVHITINNVPDMFSQRLGQECQPFDMTPPNSPIFEPANIAIVTDGLCASSCALFATAMAKHYNVTTVVAGGKQGVPQQYAGRVGGESTDFPTIDTQVKTAGLKQNPLAPPDFINNGVFDITWRLAFGIVDPTTPEEWQSRPATINLPLTINTVNNPLQLWKAVAAQVF